MVRMINQGAVHVMAEAMMTMPQQQYGMDEVTDHIEPDEPISRLTPRYTASVQLARCV